MICDLHEVSSYGFLSGFLLFVCRSVVDLVVSLVFVLVLSLYALCFSFPEVNLVLDFLL